MRKIIEKLKIQEKIPKKNNSPSKEKKNRKKITLKNIFEKK